MDMADNPKLTIKDMAESAEPEKISLSDTGNRFHYSTTKKSDSFVVDMENLNQGATDMNANSRITLQRSHSKKGIQRGEKKINSNNNYANDSTISSSPRGSSMPEKPMVVAAGATDYSISPQVHHQITISTSNIITTTSPGSSRYSNRRNSFKRSSLWVLDPKRVLLFFATLSSMGTILLIYFTLSMSKHNADEITLD
ncbi:uncharacterized protein LOC123193252 isoform X2 [Mangifera indica]|uniref:uncharacterized protein LOC123193252 isoform X2 n=1 Tax=Mangifera indica TaxID=29780 RepID=UPI001CFA56F8|nr:uncharacterized protein LOC123193252 isoform X2 [Mangifera indica]